MFGVVLQVSTQLTPDWDSEPWLFPHASLNLRYDGIFTPANLTVSSISILEELLKLKQDLKSQGKDVQFYLLHPLTVSLLGQMFLICLKLKQWWKMRCA